VGPGWSLGGPGFVPGWTRGRRTAEGSGNPYLFIYIYIYIYIYICISIDLLSVAVLINMQKLHKDVERC